MHIKFQFVFIAAQKVIPINCQFLVVTGICKKKWVRRDGDYVTFIHKRLGHSR